jgi:fido (protein-threonine AMPylation protein)
VSEETSADPGAFGILTPTQIAILERDAFRVEEALASRQRSPCDWTPSFALAVHRDAFANVFPEAAGILRSSDVSLRDLPVPRAGQVLYRLVDALAEAAALIERSAALADPTLKTDEVMVCAALFHAHCIVAQPFGDGNKRWARLLLNALLVDCGFAPGTRFDPLQKAAYHEAVDQAIAGHADALAELILIGWLGQRRIYRGADQQA